MTAKDGFLGNDNEKNRFYAVPGSNEKYFLQVNPNTGETEVWNEEFGADKRVGNFVDGKFEPNKNWWGGARKNEKEFFSSPEGSKLVRNQTEILLEKEKDGTDGVKVNNEDKLTDQERRDLSGNVDNEIGTTSTVAEQRAAADQFSKLAGEAGQGRSNYSKNLIYPITLRKGQQDRLQISVLKFSGRKLGGGGSSFKIGARAGAEGRTIGRVTLPVPTGGVADANSVGWKGEVMNPLQVAGASLGLTAITEGLEAGGAAAKKMAEDLGLSSDDAAKALGQFFVGQATGVKNVLARTEGAVINPNMELLFSAPALRPFEFRYRFTPRDRGESNMIKKIIRMFKQSMSVQTTESSIFLKAPNTYKLSFHAGGSPDHSFLPKIKECALTRFSVNYVPDGTYMTYEDSSMVSYDVGFSFKELEPVFNNDYTSLDGDSDRSIGY